MGQSAQQTGNVNSELGTQLCLFLQLLFATLESSQLLRRRRTRAQRGLAAPSREGCAQHNTELHIPRSFLLGAGDPAPQGHGERAGQRQGLTSSQTPWIPAESASPHAPLTKPDKEPGLREVRPLCRPGMELEGRSVHVLNLRRRKALWRGDPC